MTRKDEMKDRVRDAALRFLCDAERDNKFINLAVASGLSQFEDRRDKALFTLLVYGVTEKSITLDYYISKFSSRPLSELERFTKYILRLGFYQLIFMQTPGHAAVNETVALARQKGERGFVNAVLRSYLRSPEVELPKKNRMAEELRLLAQSIADESVVNTVNTPEGAAKSVALVKRLCESADRGGEMIIL